MSPRPLAQPKGELGRGHLASRAIAITLDDHLALEDAYPGKVTPRQLGELTMVGLRATENETGSRALLENLDRLSALMTSLDDLDEKPHPCPSNVDPEYWAHRERERQVEIVEQKVRMLSEVARLSQALMEAAKPLRGSRCR